ncbi:hypothetical protein HBI56_153700 [Parastagonospora nodorum]|nr:hypothetical protein HBH56_116360 [Parastagonospora nodorum]KAH3965856.1 hypothetical protein HBH51_148660 [Parastagonospora nodorum]KAH3973791.1 hypothetical protein HBH52_138690 [Parastagonospora nodorum]KAH3998532.1 hypothetical protein HBI10_125690 [Parastagonospora nodorum]KAH4088808.1 hypothetical protein HBH48_119250 [Parastagonospora nodorum]
MAGTTLATPDEATTQPALDPHLSTGHTRPPHPTLRPSITRPHILTNTTQAYANRQTKFFVHFQHSA